MNFAVLQFPGSNCDQDVVHVLKKVLGHSARLLWHKENSLGNADAVIVPGGFSYGDYLRAGAIARVSPIMDAVQAFAAAGGLVLGICNGFQILCEAGLLPGALIRNRTLKFLGQSVHVRVENADTAFTNAYSAGDVLSLHIAHGEGNYVADDATLDRLEAENRVLFRYVDPSGGATDAGNPNGSMRNIAGIMNERGNVMGLMPHPERSVELLLGSTDGLGVFTSLDRHLSGGADRTHTLASTGGR